MPRVALVQMVCEKEKRDNLRKADEFLRRAARQKAKIACFPELFLSHFLPQRLDGKLLALAEEIPGKSANALCRLARKHQVAMVAPLFEKDVAGCFYNSAVLIDSAGKIIGKYRKNHIPFAPLYQEKFYFRPGNLGYPVFPLVGGMVGIMICADRHFPEGARIVGLRGAQLVFVPAATSYKEEMWEVELRAHALQNSYYVVAVNRVGKEDEMEFSGGSLASDPYGRVLYQAGSTEEVAVVEIDFSLAQQARQRWQFYRDRRPEIYAPLVQP